MKNAFKILISDPEVKRRLHQHFRRHFALRRAGHAAWSPRRANLNLKLPVVVRMEGTNVEKGREILRESGLNFTIAEDMKDGAEKVVRLAGGAR